MDRFVTRKRRDRSTDSKQGDAEKETHQVSAKDNNYQPMPKKQKATWVRQYSETYLKYGFTNCAKLHENPKPQCVICSQVLSSESMKPSKLQRHLTTKHGEFLNKDIDFFRRKENELKSGVNVMKSVTVSNERALKASYLVAYRIAKAKAPHTIAENLILPAALDMVHELLGEKCANKIKSIPLSNSTISKRIEDISNQLKGDLLDKISKADGFTIQLDESTDVSQCATLLVYVRYPFENNFVEDILCCTTLPTNTTGEEIFKALNKTLIEEYKLDWKNLKGVTSDGAAAMTGRKIGVIKRISDAAGYEVPWVHCFIHREALASKVLSPELHDVLKHVVKIVNFIKASALNTRLFHELCSELKSEHTHLLLHTDVRWLSRGKVVKRVFELRKEIQLFCQSKKSILGDVFNNFEWLLQFAYLVDMFSYLNELNITLQGKSTDIFNHSEKMSKFLRMLTLWKARLTKDPPNMCMFLTLQALLQEISEARGEEYNVNENLLPLIVQHVQNLKDTIEHYFPESHFQRVNNMAWAKNPFLFNEVEKVIDLNLTTAEENEFLGIISDTTLQTELEQSNLSSFWLKRSTEFPHLSRKAVTFLMPFTTTYLCELGFSTLTRIKTKDRNRLNAAADMRVALSTGAPNWDKLIRVRQAHPSH